MIKTYCDCCGNEITHRNQVEFDEEQHRMKADLRSPQPVNGVSSRLSVELLTYKDDTSNAGHFCKYCILDAFAKLDDGKRPNQPKITAKAIANSAVRLVEKTAREGEAPSAAHRDILLYGIIIEAFGHMSCKSAEYFCGAFSDKFTEDYDGDASEITRLSLSLQGARNCVDNQEKAKEEEDTADPAS